MEMTEESTSAEPNTMEIPSPPPEENIKPPNQDNTMLQASSAGLIYDRTRTANRSAPIQPVKPVLGLTAEQQDI